MSSLRNQKVSEDEKVLTARHFKELAGRYLKLQFEREDKEERVGPPVRFVGKSFNQSDEDPNRVARAAGSKGYKAALEMVFEAIQARATDIHMEPTRNDMTVRFRVDGMLQPADPFSRSMGEAVINIFKVLSDMDIVEKRKPQDGSFSAQVQDRRVDFRVATAGSVAGEKLVMRIFDKKQQLMDLEPAWHARTNPRPNLRHRHPAARHAGRLRADGRRKKYDLVFKPERNRSLPEKRDHSRKPGGMPGPQRHAD